MKESYHGKIKNSAGQKVNALYSGNDMTKAKEASYKGNGAEKFTTVKKEK